MNVSVDPPAGPSPRPKQVMPPLDARAPRPLAVRLRRSVVTAAVMAAAGLFAGALGWAFLVEPGLRERAHHHDATTRPAEVEGAVRPSARVTGAPATYGQLETLPPPRQLFHPATGSAAAAAAPSPAPTPHAQAPDGLAQARQSQLFFSRADGEPPRPPAAAEPATPAGERAAAADAIAAPAIDRDAAAVYDPHRLQAPLSAYELKAGAVLPAALLTAIDTGRDGPVIATVTENVYDSVSGRWLLVPQGARLIGRHDGESRYGDSRAYLVWDRLILPNGKSLILTREPGVDAQGAVGVAGRVDRRIGALAVATLFAGAITTLGQVARDHQDTSVSLLSAGDAAAIQGAQIGGKLIDRELEVHPTIRLPPGARVRVLVTHDLVLEPFQP